MLHKQWNCVTSILHRKNIFCNVLQFKIVSFTLYFKVLLKYFKTNNFMDTKSVFMNAMSWIFGVIVFAIGIVNTFWGNDPFFGIFILLISIVYVPKVNILVKDWTGFSIHWVLKLILGLFILWAALGVGELFDKIDLMLN